MFLGEKKIMMMCFFFGMELENLTQGFFEIDVVLETRAF
jgi:hypothetical protein